MLVRRSVLWAVVVSIVLTAAAAAASQIERSESPDREPAAATAVEHSSQHRPRTEESPEAYTTLVEHPDTLVLSNTSERPIIAWIVRTVVRSSQGYEATTDYGIDGIWTELLRTGAADGILEPGESVTMKRPIGGWLREDHRGPGAGLRHYVGMIMFENDEAVGDLDVIEQTFRRRLDIARQAAAALDAIDSDPEKLRELSMYASVFAEVRDHEEALAQIRRSAAQHYRLMLDHVRPQDLEALTTEQRERGDR